MSSEDIIRWQTMDPFPKQTIERMIRSALPKRIRLSDDFKNAVNRCVQIYVLSVAATAETYYKTPNLTEQMIIGIIGLMGFKEFVEPLEHFHNELIQRKCLPKKRKSKKIDLKVDTIVENAANCEQQSSDLKSEPNITQDIEVETEINPKMLDTNEVKNI